MPVAHAKQLSVVGTAATVHRRQYPSDGPLHVDTEDGKTALKYMYAHFVFTWCEGTSRVDIGHGTVERSVPLWDGLLITGDWHPRTLAFFGATWARQHLARFMPPPLVAPHSNDRCELS